MIHPATSDYFSHRLFSSAISTATIAQDLYEEIKDSPIISPHGHVPIEWLAGDFHFRNATELFISPDHYVMRILHAQGVPLEALGAGRDILDDSQAREAFHLLGVCWNAFAGTPMRYWFEDELFHVFGIEREFNEDSALVIYDELKELLQIEEFSSRNLIAKFNIDFISTTDDPTDDLAQHDIVNADPTFLPRLAPAFRPDSYLEVADEHWSELVSDLGISAQVDTTTYQGFTEAMRLRRLYFKKHGAVLSDHSHADVNTQRLVVEEACELFNQALELSISKSDAVRLRRHLFSDQARLAQSDGLVMTVHPAVYRNYDDGSFRRFGENIGADIPAKAEFALALQPLLNEYGDNPDFHFVAFTMDETTYSRELAPLAGFYPSVFIGAPWWFLDSPEQTMRFYSDVVPIAGFSKLSGFMDDTRALCSIQTRHDMNRRLTAAYVAQLVSSHRISMKHARRIVADCVINQPKAVFKLDSVEK